MLIEDHTSFRNVMALLFEREGIKVVGQAGTLAKARQPLTSAAYAAVVDYDSQTTREKLRSRGFTQDLREGKAIATTSHETLGGRTHQLLAQRPQETNVVHHTSGEVVIDFWIAFSAVVIGVRRLIREAWTHYR